MPMQDRRPEDIDKSGAAGDIQTQPPSEMSFGDCLEGGLVPGFERTAANN